MFKGVKKLCGVICLASCSSHLVPTVLKMNTYGLFLKLGEVMRKISSKLSVRRPRNEIIIGNKRHKYH